MLGTDVIKILQSRGIIHYALDRTACDITSAEDCRRVLRQHTPDVVINCAAYTDVNRAESEEGKAMAINATGAGNLARACAEISATCIYVSTDYVFDGTKPEPYEIADPTNPINAYGRSKLAGEQAVAAALPPTDCAIARTSWLYGAAGPNFVKTMLRLAREGKDLKVIHDQVGAPTYTEDVAHALIDMAISRVYGIFHVTGTGACSWFEFAGEIFSQAGIAPPSLAPCATAQFPTPARRPANSRLSPDSLIRAGIQPLPHWKNALGRYLQESREAAT